MSLSETSIQEQIPARMVNEFAYCPRLFYLEHVQQEFAHSADTLDGRFVHRRVDRESGPVPSATALTEQVRLHSRSILIGSDRIGATARIDLIETDNGAVVPVDYKRGAAPDLPEGAWEPERVQVCLQGLLLREEGYACEYGVLYFAASQTRVTVEFTESLIARTLELLGEARRTAESGRIPPPLRDSPKCPRCSLVGICLPDETNWLMRRAGDGETGGQKDGERGRQGDKGTRGQGDGEMERQGDGGTGRQGDVEEPGESDLALSPTPLVSPSPAPAARGIATARDDRMAVYVQGQGTSVGLRGEVLEVREKGRVIDQARLMDAAQLNLFGNVQVSAQALRELVARDAPILHLSYGGWLSAVTTAPPHKNIELRRRQFATADDPAICLELARTLVAGKVRNQRTLLRRNARELPEGALHRLAEARRRAERAPALDSLLGIEGAAAREYFSNFARMFKPAADDPAPAFEFESRNRRPPRDPVNALLSFLYAMLVKDLVATLVGVGFDPYLGFYHQPRYGRPALALDLMEEFRPLIADSAAVGMINNGELHPSDFIARAGAVALTESGRRRVIEAYERRLNTEVTHPRFGYAVTYRRVFEIQARLLARRLTGEIEFYPAFCTR